MTLTCPIVEKIALQIVKRLEQVTIANGYHQDPKRIVRVSRFGNPSKEHLMIGISQREPQQDEENSREGNPPSVAWVQPFNIELWVITSDHDDVPVDSLINVFRADVEKALCTDTDGRDNWWNFEDSGETLAIDASVGEPEFMFGELGELEGVVVQFLVTYRTANNNPYVAV